MTGAGVWGIITRLIIVGAGGYGKTIEDLASQSEEYSDIKFLDDDAKNPNIIGKIQEKELFIDEDSVFYPAIGNNKLRCKLIYELLSAGGHVVSIIHPTAYVSPTVKIGVGVAILPNSSVGTNVILGDGCIVNMHAVVDHDTVLETGVHIAPGAIVKANNRITAYNKIESGVVVERSKWL